MDEHNLVLGLQAREPEAVRWLAETFGNRLLRSASLLSGSETEAEDLVQEAMLEAVRSAPRFRGKSTVYTWLYSILLNLVRHHRRKRCREILDHELATADVAVTNDIVMDVDLDAASDALANALSRLSHSHREVLVLRYYESRKLHEIAEQLGISTGTVKSRLHYAIVELQKIVPPELNLFSNSSTEEVRTR